MAAKKPTKTAQHAAHRTSRSAKAEAGEQVVTIDRRRGGRRKGTEETAKEEPKAAPVATLERRQKVQRRRQIDPTTCERDYTDAEIEFMTAMDRYRRENGRPFPTWSEVLEVVRSLGYERIEKPADLPAMITGV